MVATFFLNLTLINIQKSVHIMCVLVVEFLQVIISI